MNSSRVRSGGSAWTRILREEMGTMGGKGCGVVVVGGVCGAAGGWRPCLVLAGLPKPKQKNREEKSNEIDEF